MNYIIKSVVKKVFQQYLNLENSLDFESGTIKLAQGSLNQQKINQKLSNFKLQIISSQYKNLSISVPFTQIVSKPIKINIQKFNVVIKKQVSQKKKNFQDHQTEINNEKIYQQDQNDFQKQNNHFGNQQGQKKSTKSTKNPQNVGYIKNMVNRLLYNMQVHIENVSLTLVEQGKNSIHFQVNGFHIKNSLVLLEADIIKKIFNLQTLKIIHLYGQFLIKDFNICLDYNNKKLGILAILNSLHFQLSKLPISKIQDLLKQKKSKIFKKAQQSEKKIKKTQNLQIEKQVNSKKQDFKQQNSKKLQINCYLKIVQLKIKTTIISLIGQMMEIKYKNTQNNETQKKQTFSQMQLLFRKIALINKNEQNILELKYLPYSKEVRIYSQYEDNILKSSLIKCSVLNTHSLNTKNQSKITSRHIKGQIYYVSLLIQLDVFKLLAGQFISYEHQVKIILSFIQKHIKSKQQSEILQKQPIAQNQMNSVNNFADFVIYRFMTIVQYKNIQLKIYGSLNFQYGDINGPYFNITTQQSSIYQQTKLQKKLKKSSISNSSQSSQKQRQNQRRKKEKGEKLNLKNQQLVSVGYFGVIQFCCQINKYLILDLYNLQTKCNSLLNGDRQLVMVGTNLISELSIQLIHKMSKQIPQLIRDVQTQIKNIKKSIQIQNKYQQYQNNTVPFLSQICQSEQNFNQTTIKQKIELDIKQNLKQDIKQGIQNDIYQDTPFFFALNKISQLIFLPYKKNKKNHRKNKTTLFLKINQVNIKLGTLSNNNKFFWIVEAKLSDVQFLYKQRNLKLKSEMIGFISSPHTLHRSPLSNQFVIQIKYFFQTQELLVNVKNNIVLYFQEKYILIISKYIKSQLKAQKKKQTDMLFKKKSNVKNSNIKNSNIKDRNSKNVSLANHSVDNSYQYETDQQYLCIIYNLTSNALKFIQTNQNSLENSIDSLEFQNFDDQQGPAYLKEQNVIQIKEKSKQAIFFMNQDQFFLQLNQNQTRSFPILIHSIKGEPSGDQQYPYHFQSMVEFDEEELDGKYSLYFLLNHQGKIQKIFFKYSMLVVSYKNTFYISLENKSVQTSPIQQLQLLKFQNWIQFYKNVKVKDQSNLIKNKQKNSSRKQSQYDILLDLDEQTLKFQVYLDQQQKQKLKIKNLMKADNNYSLYGIYKQVENINLKGKLYQCYMYEKKCLKSTYFIIMPFLIIKNNLGCAIQIELINKKTQQKSTYSLTQEETLQMKPELFDFYNKQFTLKIKLISKKLSKNNNQLHQQRNNQSHQQSKNNYLQEQYVQKQPQMQNLFKKFQLEKQPQKIQEKQIYESQQHYFNTFFMVQHSFQTCIQLRSNLKHKYDRKNILLKEQLILKTKVLIIDNPLKIVNNTSFNFGIKVKQNANNQERGKSQIRNQPTYILSQNELQNQYFFIPKNGEIDYVLHLKQSDALQILFENMSQNKIEAKYSSFFNGHTVLSFNFVKIKDYFCHVLFRGRIKNSSNGQVLLIQDYITFTNISNTIVSYYGINVQRDQTKCFVLPPTANNRFNNKVINLGANQLQIVFKQLFHDQKQRISQKSMKIKIDNNEIQFETLLKLNLKEINLHNQYHVFSLLKDLKNCINFYLSDKIFNPSINYTLFNNFTTNNFLLSDDTEYTHHFKFQQNQYQKQKKRQKILINQHSFNILLNKQNHQLLLCDANAKHLQKTSKFILKKEQIKIQCYNIDKFNIIDVTKDDQRNSQQNAKTKTNAQIFTKSIQINIKLYDKLSLSASIKNLSIRFLQQNKFDCLVQDIMIKDNISNQHILRVPQETFILLQAKTFNQNFILIKNLFIKCKNIIVNVDKGLPYTIISLCKNISGTHLQQQKSEDKKKSQSKQSLIKIYNYLNEKLFLVKNICIHEIHLSISLNLEDLNFSNVVILPQFQLKNKFLRQKNLLNQLNEFYMTNLVGKLPKLSFIVQNIRNPINMIKTLIKVGSALNDKILDSPLLSFNHSQIPQNEKLFSIQRWNVIHKKTLEPDEYMIVQMIKNKTYYIISNLNLIVISMNRVENDISSKNLVRIQQLDQKPHEQQQQEEQKIVSKNIIRMSSGTYIQKISLKDLQKLKVIKNKKNSEIIMKFKKNRIISLCDQHKKCSKLINAISRLVL